MRRNRKTENEIHSVVRMTAVTSAEHFVRADKPPRRVLERVYLRIDRGQAWGITAPTDYEIRLLLEVMGNITPYEDGKCVLTEWGMPRRKRVIQPHVFYIDGSDMLYGNMNVLEYLCFATEPLRRDRLPMQAELFERLIDAGLGYISLTGIKWLTAQEKAVVALLAAAYSGSMLIVFNIPHWPFDERLQSAIAHTARMVTAQGRALVVGTQDCSLIQRACSHTAFLARGRIHYQGTTDYLRRHFDKAVVIVEDEDINEIKNKLAPVLTGCELAERSGQLLVTVREGAVSPLQIYRRIAAAGITPRVLRVNEKTVDNAYWELMRQHDIPKQLV